MLRTWLVASLAAVGAANWIEDTSVTATKGWSGITSNSDGTKLAATVMNGNIWTSTRLC